MIKIKRSEMIFKFLELFDKIYDLLKKKTDAKRKTISDDDKWRNPETQSQVIFFLFV